MSYSDNQEKISVSNTGKIATAAQADSATNAELVNGSTTFTASNFRDATVGFSTTKNFTTIPSPEPADSIQAIQYLQVSSGAQAGNNQYGESALIRIGALSVADVEGNYTGASAFIAPAQGTPLQIGGFIDPNSYLVPISNISGSILFFAISDVRFHFTNQGTHRVSFSNVSPYASKSGGGAWGTLSDARLKENVREIGSALDKIITLRPVHFEFINQGETANPAGTRTGFIAQEFEQVLPGHTFEMEPMCDADKQLLGEDVKAKGIEADLVPYLVKATQELNTKLEQENLLLKQQLAALSARLDALEAK